MAQALQRLGTRRAVVVCGEDGLDEVTLRGPTLCSETTAGTIREFTWVPADFGLEAAGDLSDLQVTGPEESAAIIRDVLKGSAGTALEHVILNAAAALWTAEQGSPQACAQAARQAITSGAAEEKLRRLAELSHA